MASAHINQTTDSSDSSDGIRTPWKKENNKYNKYYALRNDALIKNNSNNLNNKRGATDQSSAAPLLYTGNNYESK